MFALTTPMKDVCEIHFVVCEIKMILKPVVLTEVLVVCHETTTENKDVPLLSVMLASWKASEIYSI